VNVIAISKKPSDNIGMFDQDELIRLGATESHLQFARFLSDQKGGALFVDYQKLDLMRIPKLVPDIWVLDFRQGIDGGLLLHFSGSRIDGKYGEPITNKRVEDIYSGHFGEQILDALRKVHLEKCGVFFTRNDFFERSGSQLVRRIVAVNYPCSSDGENVDFGIGLTTFEETKQQELDEPIISILSS